MNCNASNLTFAPRTTAEQHLPTVSRSTNRGVPPKKKFFTELDENLFSVPAVSELIP